MSDGEGAVAEPPGWRRGLAGLVIGQSLGAFCDNAYKFAITLMVTQSILKGPGEDGEVRAAQFLTWTGLAFLLPFIVLSPVAGPLSDRVSKRGILIGMKLVEALVYLAGIQALGSGNPAGLLVVLCGTAIASAISSPAKYGILPQMLPAARLPAGNGVLQLSTMISVIAGIVAAGAAVEHLGARLPVIAFVLAGLSALGAAASGLIPALPAVSTRSSWNVIGEFAGHYRTILASRTLRLSVLGIVWFWFLAVLFQTNAPLYGTVSMMLTEFRASALLAAVALGIGAGSFVAGMVSGGKVELGLVPLGSVGLSVFCIALHWTTGSYVAASAAMFALGFSGGFFLIPLVSLVQQEAPADGKGGMVAASNMLEFGAMAGATGVYWLLTTALRRPPEQVFLIAGVATLLATVYVVRLLPEALARLVLWFATRTVYRLTVLGRENLPDKGGALLVCNHVSYVDGLLVLSSTRRFIRFLVFKGVTQIRGLSWIGRMLRIIPIDEHSGPKALLRSLEVASDALNNGELVCIFAEGEISRTGQLLPFRGGMERILKKCPGVPVIPVNLDGVWGSIFSRAGGRFLFKRPRQVPYPVTVSFGKPLPGTSTPAEVRQAIQDLATEAFFERKSRCEPLGEQFIRTSRKMWRRFAAADLSGAKVTHGQLLVKAAFVARAMREHWDGQERVGLLLPPSVGGFVANCAVLLAGKIPVNLNYTSNEESLRSSAKQCGLRNILTSKAFLEKLPLPEVAPFLYMEDLAPKATLPAKLRALAAARLMPRGMLSRWAGRTGRPKPDDVAGIIFSSGSTGEPKGVQLTHFNLTSNIQSFLQVFDMRQDDVLMGILPFFHSFGFLTTLILPACVGVGVAFHANPLDARVVGHLCRTFGGTFLLATPTFLQSYTRRCEPGDFGSLKHVVVGAEKLQDRVGAAFREKFGIDPLEGYGTTECSPVIAVNTPGYRSRGFHQAGNRRGTIGQPVPGVSVRIRHVETGEIVPFGQEGVLYVRGPNVMKGYLGKPEETDKVLKDGWYRTGDIAKMDEDGFITITDRLNRFSKIGGEMVPYVKIEEALHQAIGAREQVLVVTAVPDEKKGERLVVLHTLTEVTVLIGKLGSLGLPNLWVPREDHIFRIEALPLLGSGKADLRKARDLAKWHLAKGGLGGIE